MTMLKPSLRAGVGVARFDDCVIVLDVHADRYISMARPVATPLLWIAGIEAGPVDPTRLERLITLGLVERSERVLHLPKSIAPTRNAAATPTGPHSVRLVPLLEIALHLVGSITDIRFRRLKWVLATLNGRQRHPTSEIEELASNFLRYRRLLPIRSVCLADSIALLRFLMRRGHRPHLVFGVDAHPFAAHCWVQCGDVVLNDEIDHVRRFAPILVI